VSGWTTTPNCVLAPLPRVALRIDADAPHSCTSSQSTRRNVNGSLSSLASPPPAAPIRKREVLTLCRRSHTRLGATNGCRLDGDGLSQELVEMNRARHAVVDLGKVEIAA